VATYAERLAQHRAEAARLAKLVARQKAKTAAQEKRDAKRRRAHALIMIGAGVFGGGDKNFAAARDAAAAAFDRGDRAGGLALVLHHVAGVVAAKKLEMGKELARVQTTAETDNLL